MANVQIPNLPAVSSLSGEELFEGVQAGSSVKISLGQVIAAANLGTPISLPLPISIGGTSATTAEDARTNLGLGTVAVQNANSVVITGGSVNGTTIGGVTPAGGSFTTGNFGVGAVGTPSIAFSGDANTGIWSPAADTVAISTNGSERIRIVSDGRIGVGVSAPASGAFFDVTSTSGGLIIPRMTTVQRDAISSPTNGVMIYNTTNVRFEIRSNNIWTPVVLSFDTVSELLANTSMTYPSTPTNTIIEADGFRYTVAATGVTDQNITTAGGLKLYVQPTENGYNVRAFGSYGDGVTNDAPAVQAAINAVETFGGSLLFPPGKYLFGSQVTIDRTYAAVGSNFVGERNLIIFGYGAEIRTTGAITAFDVTGGWSPNHTCLLEGFTIYHRGNTQAVGGVRMIGTSLVTCREVTVVVSSSLPAGYAAFSMQNLDPADPDTGCFWNLIDQCSIRPWEGVDGFCTYGVKLMGAANATTLRNNNLSGSSTHVILMPHPGETYVSNSVNIDGNFFEGPVSATGINLVGVGFGAGYHVSGTRITNNRFESINTAVTLTGAGTTVQIPTYMSGNYADTSVPNYLVNTLNIPVIKLDFSIVGSPMGPAKMVNQEGLLVENQNASYDTITAIIPNLGRGIVLQRFDGLHLGSVRYSNAAAGIGMQIAGSYSPYRPLTIKGCQGIAARDIAASNLAGASSFSASTTRVVTLPNAETDANYLIFLDARANQKLWISARTTTDFTVESDVSSSNGFGWLLIRHL
jgi:hypothetical protein